MKKKLWLAFNLVLIAAFALSACQSATPAPAPTSAPAAQQPTQAPAAKKLKVGLISDVGGVNDKSFNQGAWEGVQKAAKEFGFDANYVESKQPTDYEKNIDSFATEGYDVIVTVGFMMGDATAGKAKQYPNIKFAIVDNAYFPTKGYALCPDTVKDCYVDGGLTNVTSLMFQEDQVGFLAGVVAAGMSKSGTVCTVSGMEIPPVVRYVTGFQNGAKWMNPSAKTLNVYIPSFVDPAKGKETGQAMIGQGCDVVFGVGGNTGNGGLLAAKEGGLMAIGVDVDQYNTYPEVASALVTSAQKNVDTAVYNFLKSVNDGSVKAGAVTANLQNGGVGLAPYHDWDSKVPQTVKDKVTAAIDGIKAGTINVSATAATSLTSVAPAPAAGGAPVHLTIWHGYHAGGSEETTVAALVKQYMADHPNVTVDVLEVDFSQLFKKWDTQVAAGSDTPDMFTAPNDSLGDEVRNGTIAPIDDLVKGKLGNYLPAGVAGMTVGGKIYGVPGIIKAVGLYYNTANVSNPPKTTDDLMALVKSGKKLTIMVGGGAPYFNYGWFPAFGATMFAADGTCTADQAGGTEAMQYLLDLKTAGASFESDGGKAATAFKQGETDMIVDGPWMLGDYEKALGSKLGVVPMPAGPKGTSTPLSGIDGWYLNPNGKNMAAAIDLALYLFGPDGLKAYEDNAGDPAVIGSVQSKDPLVTAFAAVGGGGFPRPQDKWFSNYWTPFTDLFTHVLEGGTAPKDAVAKACADMNKANGK